MLNQNTLMQSIYSKKAGLLSAACVGLLVAAAVPGQCAQASPAHLHNGVLYGEVVSSTNGSPVPGATVALRNKAGHIIAWTLTNAQGRYALAAHTLAVLHLASHHTGMLQSIRCGFVSVVDLPIQAAHVAVKAAGVVVGAATDTALGVVKAVNPVGTLKAVAISVAEGNPLPLAGQAITNLRNAFVQQAPQAARKNMAQALVNSHLTAHKKTAAVAGPGEVNLLVNASQYKRYRGVAGSYWMESPVKVSAKRKIGAQAWLDTVTLAPSAVAKAQSGVLSQVALLSAPAVVPAFAAAGTPVQISVHLDNPADPAGLIRVVALEQKTHRAAELQSMGHGLYKGLLVLSPRSRWGNTTITVAALNAHPVGVNLPKGKTKPLLAYAQKLNSLHSHQPYLFNPRVMASENRIDLIIRVLNPALETPPMPLPASVPMAPLPIAPPPTAVSIPPAMIAAAMPPMQVASATQAVKPN